MRAGKSRGAEATAFCSRGSASLLKARRVRALRVFSGNTGIDPYTTAVSDVYQDLFAEETIPARVFTRLMPEAVLEDPRSRKLTTQPRPLRITVCACCLNHGYRVAR